jgi:hypothetical protein
MTPLLCRCSQWGFEEVGGSKNLCALFFGPPGTGKTMAASVGAAHRFLHEEEEEDDDDDDDDDDLVRDEVVSIIHCQFIIMSKNLCALFFGPPGTGKTMAASVGAAQSHTAVVTSKDSTFLTLNLRIPHPNPVITPSLSSGYRVRAGPPAKDVLSALFTVNFRSFVA